MESIGSQHLELRLACSGRQPSPYFSPECETPGSLLVTCGEQHLYLWRYTSSAAAPAGERRWMSCLFSFRPVQGRRIYEYAVRCTRRGMATRRSAHAQFIHSEGRAVTKVQRMCEASGCCSWRSSVPARRQHKILIFTQTFFFLYK